MGWSLRETDRIIDMCTSEHALRTRLVGHEVFARIYGAGVSPDQVGETLISIVSDHVANG
jgi:hypothetical protein